MKVRLPSGLNFSTGMTLENPQGVSPAADFDVSIPCLQKSKDFPSLPVRGHAQSSTHVTPDSRISFSVGQEAKFSSHRFDYPQILHAYSIVF
mmetsp:Transcript_15953/g.39101  ORF Transcript_15953/g.39101 Transcript_15953/m.39101 type:complete len:92 (-) Transcript_15953:605-880(-)